MHLNSEKDVQNRKGLSKYYICERKKRNWGGNYLQKNCTQSNDHKSTESQPTEVPNEHSLSSDNNKSTKMATVFPTTVHRQLSEGNPPLDSVLTGLQPRSSTMPPLRSILKKPKMESNGNGHAGDQPRNHLRRMPTRYFPASEGAGGSSITESNFIFLSNAWMWCTYIIYIYTPIS